jgi:hypothetical protein
MVATVAMILLGLVFAGVLAPTMPWMATIFGLSLYWYCFDS